MISKASTTSFHQFRLHLNRMKSFHFSSESSMARVLAFLEYQVTMDSVRFVSPGHFLARSLAWILAF